jgi:RNA polymerase sigma-70 factor (ECF subfamily)
MVRRLYSLFPKLDDPHWVHDAVVDALLNYVQHPEKYSPVRGKLSAYLFMSARGDLLNRLEREGRRRKKEIPLEDVELHPIMRNILVEEENTGDQIPYGMSISGLTEALNQVIKDQVDKELLDLIIDGERKTECYSKILGISHLPIDEQRKQVKRAKDRLTKRLRRLGKSNEPR